jgi:hypothetical protein
MQKLLLFTLTIFLVLIGSAACSPVSPVTIHEVSSPMFSPGQIWTYRTRPGESASHLVILRVDAVSGKDGEVTVVHVRIEGLSLQAGKNGSSTLIPFISFSEYALKKSVLQMQEMNQNIPDFQSGYNQWKASYLAGKGSFFVITVAQAINQVEAALNPTSTPEP